jgi:DNA-binding NtrC family response regulator
MDKTLLNGKKIFIVEDEALIVLALEMMLEELGCLVSGSATSLADGIDIARTVEADAAVLDIRLGAANSQPIAELLAERGVPLLYATGYAGEGAPDGWPQGCLLVKPYELPQLGATLSKAIAG